MPSKSYSDPKSVGDYLGVAMTLSTLPIAVVSDTMTNMFAGNKRRSVVDTVLDSVMGHCYRQSTLRQLRILTPVHSLEDELNSILYTLLMSNMKLPNFNTPFNGPGFAGRWITEVPDRTPDDPVIMYMHGGGYALKTCQPQITYICSLARHLARYRVSIIALDYDIAPFYKYPIQHNEGVACLAELLKTCNRPILLGDSCGGNLALSILQEEDVIPAGSVFGLALVSPWTDPFADGESMYSTRDILSKKRLDEMCESFVDAEHKDDPRVAPSKAPREVWDRILPKNTCVVWGEAECLADQVKDFVESNGIKEYLVERNGTHDCILRGLSPPPSQFITDHIIEWIAAEVPSATTTSLTTSTQSNKSIPSNKSTSSPKKTKSESSDIEKSQSFLKRSLSKLKIKGNSSSPNVSRILKTNSSHRSLNNEAPGKSPVKESKKLRRSSSILSKFSLHSGSSSSRHSNKNSTSSRSSTHETSSVVSFSANSKSNSDSESHSSSCCDSKSHEAFKIETFHPTPRTKPETSIGLNEEAVTTTKSD